MRTTYSKLFSLEHPVTGEEHHFWVDVDVTHDKERHTLQNGDPGTPEHTHVGIINWGLCQDDTKPEWVEPWQIDEAVDEIDLSTIIEEDDEFDYEEHDN